MEKKEGQKSRGTIPLRVFSAEMFRDLGHFLQLERFVFGMFVLGTF
jgi:hypothetical protein